MQNLKPCPFCGKNDLLRIKAIKHDHRSTFPYIGVVTCLNCFSRIMSHGFSETPEKAKKEAVIAWNRRAYKESITHD